MAKKINIKLIDINTLKFELNESGEKGDYIVLSDLSQVSFDEITKQLEVKRNDILKQIWEREKNNIINSSEEFKNLQDQLANARKEIEVSKLNLEREFESKLNQHQQQIIKLETEKASLVRETEMKITSNFSERINELEKNLIEKNNEIRNINDKKQLELEANTLKVESSIKDRFREIIEEKDSKISELENRRNMLNIKEIGEDLENFMKSEASNNLSLPNVSFKKSNDIIDGTKPDFIFDVLNNDGVKITSVTIEAKSETLNAKTKKKNDEHIEKLDSDRKKQGSEYALLVTELEKDDEFIFKKVGEYENMYMVRPRYFVPFLQLIYNISQKREEINNLEINFKDKQEILEEFDSFKNEVLQGVLLKISKSIEEIKDQANKAISANEKIIDRARVMTTHMDALGNKFEKFKIQKLLDKLDN